MGSEDYVGVTRILPHFTEPDLVFGNIGGKNSIINYSFAASLKFNPTSKSVAVWQR